MQTSRQFRQRLLCKACEHRFNVGGEDYVSRVCYQVDRSFPLRARPPMWVPGAWEAVAIGDAEAKALCYFASSIVWRDNVMKDRGVRLGCVYREQFRRYLVGAAPFPGSNARVTAVVLGAGTLATSMDRIGLPPITARSGRQCHRHVFIICGLEFGVHVGRELPDELGPVCMATGGYRFLRMRPPEQSPLVQASIEYALRMLGAQRR